MEGGLLVADSVDIRGTTSAALWLYAPDDLEYHNSNIVPNSGYAVKFELGHYPPSRTYDMTGNYWGTTDSTAIAALIWDGHDSAQIDDFIGYVPFAGGVSVERQAWGAVKSLFR
jgi:hypothetical protein